MLDAANQARKFTDGRSRSDLDVDKMLALSIVRLVEIIGEAAKNVSDDFRMDSSQVPWKQIAGTRDRLAHGYFDVDLDIIWSIVTNDLPVLIVELEKIIPAND
jgi:uncharacterized protein with HEPN domain